MTRRPRTKSELMAARRLRELDRAIGVQLRTIREDAGARAAAVARSSGISASHLSGIEAGEGDASLDALVAVATALGADISIHVYPGAGIPLRDRFQARMIEELLRSLHPRWGRFLEVPVSTPARGLIDAVLVDRQARLLVAVEAQSELRRLEAQLRWHTEKAAGLARTGIARAALATSDDGVLPEIDRLLLLRSTRATRDLATRFEATLAAAYPARARDLLEALAGTEPWPGSGIAWVEVEGRATRILAGPPRGVRVGS